MHVSHGGCLRAISCHSSCSLLHEGDLLPRRVSQVFIVTELRFSALSRRCAAQGRGRLEQPRVASICQCWCISRGSVALHGQSQHGEQSDLRGPTRNKYLFRWLLSAGTSSTTWTKMPWKLGCTAKPSFLCLSLSSMLAHVPARLRRQKADVRILQCQEPHAKIYRRSRSSPPRMPWWRGSNDQASAAQDGTSDGA